MKPSETPQAKVRFAAGWLARVARFARAESAARRTPREDLANDHSRAAGGGGEFAGRRRYRPGDDLRHFDWEALARGAGPLVRMRQRDSGERWCVLLDSSASMAVGDPPKLQLAAELALAILAVGLEHGFEVSLATRKSVAVFRATSELARASAELEELSSAGANGFEACFAHPSVGRASRWILIGDFLDMEPASLDAIAVRTRRLVGAAVLAPIELSPLALARPGSAIEWRDPERGERLPTLIGTVEVASYAALLSEHLGRWHAALARTRGGLVVAQAGQAFEAPARRILSNLVS